MKELAMFVICGLIAFGVIAISACQTDQPGVRSTFHSQYTTVTGNTTKVTKVAVDVLQDLKLKDIDSQSTAVDGWAIGYTADDKKISVDIRKVTESTSEVSVYVGSVGDPKMGTDIVARIREKTDG